MKERIRKRVTRDEEYDEDEIDKKKDRPTQEW